MNRRGEAASEPDEPASNAGPRDRAEKTPSGDVSHVAADGTAPDGDVHRLLEAVIDLTPTARQRYLAQHAANPSVARLIESMLRDEEALGTFLDRGVLAEDSEPATEPNSNLRLPAAGGLGPGDRLGPFRIQGLLGQGGMGQVFRAEQEEPIRRQVALKVIHHAIGSEAGPRFQAERQALGRLSHPNIARLYEAGATDDGRLFVAMELVDGVPITRYCDEHRLSFHERLQLFVAVCRGTQHAHEKQILHRDLKPSNILVTEVDGRASVKIIDFGIAKALGQPLTEQTLITGQGLIGTPHYMSPEALTRDPSQGLDTRSDVYALGVVLYELLSGQRPFTTPSSELPRLLREILETPPARPSRRVRTLEADRRRQVAEARNIQPDRLGPLLARDLDWIVTKAMAKQREDRYASTAELADELERVLADQPVSARPPSTRYRLGKWALRNRLAAGLGSLTAAGLIVATILTSMALVRAQRAERQIRIDARAPRQALDVVVDLFEAASPEMALGRAVDAVQLLDAGATRIHDTDLEPLPRAEILSTLARLQVHLGHYQTAIALVTESLKIRERSLAVDDPAVLSNLELLANALRQAGRGAEAEPLLERLVASARATGDPVALGSALDSYGNLLWQLDRLDEAEAMHREALTLRIETLGEPSTDVASSHNNLGVLFYSSGRYLESEPHFRKAAVVLTAQVGEMHPSTAHALNNLGNVFHRTGRYAEALATQERVLTIRTTVLGQDHPSTSATHNNVGTLWSDLGSLTEAETHYRRALDIRRETLGPGHAETITSLANLGNVLRRQGRLAEAEPHLVEALDQRLRHFGPGHFRVARSRRNLALLARDAGRLAEARPVLEEVLATQRATLGDNHHDVASTRHHLAVLELTAGQNERAEDLLREAIHTRRELGLEGEKRLADSLVTLADVVARLGRTDEHDTLVNEALSIRKRILPTDHPDLVAISG